MRVTSIPMVVMMSGMTMMRRVNVIIMPVHMRVIVVMDVKMLIKSIQHIFMLITHFLSLRVSML